MCVCVCIKSYANFKITKQINYSHRDLKIAVASKNNWIFTNFSIKDCCLFLFQNTASLGEPRGCGDRGERWWRTDRSTRLSRVCRAGSAARRTRLFRQGGGHLVAGRAAVHDAGRPLSVQRRSACVPLRKNLARPVCRAGGFESARQVPDPLASAKGAVRATVRRGRAAASVVIETAAAMHDVWQQVLVSGPTRTRATYQSSTRLTLLREKNHYSARNSVTLAS